jgi:hypothetical protein
MAITYWARLCVVGRRENMVAKFKVSFVAESSESDREVNASKADLAWDEKWWLFSEGTGDYKKTVLYVRADQVSSIELVE